MRYIFQALILVISAIAIYGTYGLAVNEWKTGNICPKILGIPACYLVLLCFIMAFLAQLIPENKFLWIYFIFVGIVTLIATVGTIGELTGMTHCPRTTGGTPMCFISLGFCISLLLFKIITLQIK